MSRVGALFYNQNTCCTEWFFLSIYEFLPVQTCKLKALPTMALPSIVILFYRLAFAFVP